MNRMIISLMIHETKAEEICGLEGPVSSHRPRMANRSAPAEAASLQLRPKPWYLISETRVQPGI